jgi:hypothetical protein
MMLAAAATAALGLTFASPAGADDIPGNWIENRGFEVGLCLQPADGSFDTGAPIEQVTCNRDTALQRWEWSRVSPNEAVYRIRNVATQLCLDALGGATNHTPVVQWPCNQISNEKWDRGADHVHIRSRVSGTTSHCLDVPADSMQEHVHLQLYRCTSPNGAQTWDTTGPDGPIIR